jgi:hypothetical protein
MRRAGCPAQSPLNPVFRASSAVPVWSAMLVSGCAFFAAQTITWDRAAWVAVLAVLLAAIPRRVEVGAEGLRIAWLGPPRLVRYEDVRRAEPCGADDVIITFDGGETLRLARGVFDVTSPRDVLERIWQTVTLGAEGRVRPNERCALARGDRSADAWLEDLRGLARRGAHYRQGILPADRLLAIATNPAVEIELRCAAAVGFASAGGLDDATSEELRLIASLTVDPVLRAVFERVAEAKTEEDLRSALREAA